MWDADAEIEALLAAEEAEPPRNLPDPRSILHPAQIPAYDCCEQERAILAGRRFGKSVLLCAGAIAGALAHPTSPDLIVPYITRTKSNARRDVWPVLKRFLGMLGIGRDTKITNEGTLECQPIPGGARIVLGGCETEADVELWRGPKYGRAIVDECGAFPGGLLDSLCTNALEPGLADVGGDIWKAGSPGYVFDGPWFKLTGHLRSSGVLAPQTSVPVFHGNMFGNPHMFGGDIEKLREFAAKVREKNGWTLDSPTYQREWEPGMWVQDLSELVYPFTPERNGVARLPYPIDDPGWTWCIAADIGNVQETGIVVMGAHRYDRNEYIVHSEKEARMLIERLAQRIISLREVYPRATIVIDTGGMGKQHAHEVGVRFGIPSIPADKRDRQSNVRLTHEGFLAGTIKVLDGPQCDEVRREDGLLRWNTEHTDHDKSQRDPKTGQKMDHCADARLYARQWLHKYRTENEPQAHRLGTKEFYDAQEQEIIRQMERELVSRDADPWDV